MPIRIRQRLTARSLLPKIERLFDLSAGKILRIEKEWQPSRGTPVFTVRGRYGSRGWTEWTQGFQYGSALLQFDATGEERFLQLGRRGTIERMASHVSHIGVHDHGFNNISTYGNLLRLLREGRIPAHEQEKDFYELALKVSGAVQAARWTQIAGGSGFIHSFNGPHSLFIDTVRSLRSLAAAHQLGHVLMGERDRKISLLGRLLEHLHTTVSYSIFYGKGRDAYDLPGRVAHECIFNLNDGQYRCPNSQQGYSPFTTWTRGLAWALLGLAEQLEFLKTIPPTEINQALAGSAAASGNTPFWRSARESKAVLERAAEVVGEFYIANSCRDGVPAWDTGAPLLPHLGDYLNKPSDPFNRWEPVDSSAAAIAAQGLIRLGDYFTGEHRSSAHADRFRQAGLTIADTLFTEPYLSTNSRHQGLLLHSVYHRPNGWDHIAPGQNVPNGESSMWGDYHARELALLLLREAKGKPRLAFFAL